MKTLKLLVVLFLSVFAISSCSYRLVDFTVISTKNVSLDIDKSAGKSVSGTSSGLFGWGSSIKDAMDEALGKAGPDYDLLVDGVVRVNDYLFVVGYKVTGLAVSSKKLRAELGEKGYEDWCRGHRVFDPEVEAKSIAQK